MLTPFRFVALEQFGRFGVEHVAQRVECAEVDAFHRAGNKTLRRRDGDSAATRLGERVGPFQATAFHEFGQAKSHVQHATNVCTEAGRCNTEYTFTTTLVHVPVSRYSAGMDASDEVAAIDAANEPVRLCVICHASYPVGIAGYCASCLYDFYPDDSTTTPTNREAHAA